eukprot:Opistho-2@13861
MATPAMAAWGDSGLLENKSGGDTLSIHERAFFENCFRELDPAGTNGIAPGAAATYFRTSALSDAMLAQIWTLAVGGKPSVDKQSFFVALKLIALAQNGKEVALSNLSAQTPMPQFKGSLASSSGPTISASAVIAPSAGEWLIKPQEKDGYDKFFIASGAVNGYLAGDKAKGVLMNSKLPFDILKTIWELSDIDKDGQLDADEFAVAMHLTHAARAGRNPPPALPASLLPPSKRRSSTPSSLPSSARSSAASISGIAALPVAAAPAVKSTAWVVTDAEKQGFDAFFREADKDKDGWLSGNDAREIFLKSGLPGNILAHIWSLADVERAGRLNAESFALAMYLITGKLNRGQDPPAALTPEMIPPYFRSNPAAASLVGGVTRASLDGGIAPASSGAPAISPLVSQSAATAAVKRPSTQTLIADILRDKPPAPSSEVGGGDFSAIKELDDVSKEIDTISKDKEVAEKETADLEQQVAQVKLETADMKAKVELATTELTALQTKKLDAQRRLTEVEQEKASFDKQLTAVREQFDAETAEINSLKARIEQQQQSMRQQEDSVRRTNAELEALREEESKLRADLDKGRRDLEALHKQQQHAHAEMEAVRQKIEQVAEARQQLEQQSTPAAITAVAKASISSLDDVFAPSSGMATPPRFSTASVLTDPFSKSDPFLDDPFVSSRNGDDVFKAADPFKAPAEDPFKANDPFKAANSDPFKANDDPFHTADPFKGNDDPFKAASDDPFAASPAVGAKSSDPFGSGGDDPFKSADPFAGGGSAAAAFGSDPFGGAPAVGRADSVRSAGSGSFKSTPAADPFAEDPFNSKPATSSTAHAASAAPASVFSSDPFKSDDPFGAKGGFASDFEASFPETI